MTPFIERYCSAAYGGMSRSDEGRFVQYDDVVDLLERELGHDRTQAIIREYFYLPETCDDREFA